MESVTLRANFHSEFTVRIVYCFVATLIGTTTAFAAPVKINGASFDAPANCQAAPDALVCNIDGQQLEISVHRQPFAASADAADSLVKRGAAMQELHSGVVASLMKGTSSLYNSSFDSYGKLSGLGTLMAGRGEVTAPSARVVTLYSHGELWQILEVIAKRTAAVEALTEALAKSLVLPPPAPVVATTTPSANTSRPASTPAAPVAPPAPIVEAAPPAPEPKEEPPLDPIQTFQNALITFQYPSELAVTTDTKEGLAISAKHKTRPGRPSLSITLRSVKNADDTADAFITARKAAVAASMGNPGTVNVNKLGDINGSGFAIIGTPDVKKGGSGIESFECTFATVINGKLLAVTLNAEQKFAEDAQYLWGLVGKSLVVK